MTFYKGYEICILTLRRGVAYTVYYGGDELVFDEVAQAMDFIDSIA